MFAAAWGVHARNRGQALRALMRLRSGTPQSIALCGRRVCISLSMDRVLDEVLAGGLLRHRDLHWSAAQGGRGCRVGTAGWRSVPSCVQCARRGLMLVRC